MILFLFTSLSFWVELVKVEFKAGTLVIALILTVIGGFGLAILIRIIDRMIFYKSLLIRKDSSRISLEYKPDRGLVQYNYSPGAKLSVVTNSETTLLNIGEDDNQRTIIKFKKLGTISIESLKGMAEIFNN